MRSAFASLMQNLYVDADPQIVISFIDFSRVCVHVIYYTRPYYYLIYVGVVLTGLKC